MTRIQTAKGEIEIIQTLNKRDLLVRFVETGGTVITTMKKIESGNIKDPLVRKQRKLVTDRWMVELEDGEIFQAPELTTVAEKTGVHAATVRKIAQGTRKHKAIVSIVRI